MEQIALLNKILTQIKQREGKNYISFAALLTKLGKTGCKLFGLAGTKPSAAIIEKSLSPYLDNTFMILKGSRTSFLAFKLPIDEIVFEALRIKFQKGPFSPGQLTQHMPMKKDEFIACFNRLLETMRISVSVNAEFKVTVRNINASGSTVNSTPATIPTPQIQISTSSLSPQDDRKQFREAFDELDKGRIFVRICNLRRKLGWDKTRFNSLLRQLRAEGIVQLHAGDISSMSEEDIDQSFTDESNFFYATLTMKPQTNIR
ncbi:MAG: hypothetical protein LBP87_13910 [Planctomycetaceae bacterium]|jgi:hypothetical protein|nr:hypothetical protein [Planctomycetaceae bacterium]